MKSITIAGRKIGPNEPVYVIAEVSANHNRNFDQAVRLLEVAKESGADAVKIQTYTADTITLNVRTPHFQVGGGTIWDGRTLYDLYQEAYTPWDWQPKLKAIADQLGITLFSWTSSRRCKYPPTRSLRLNSWTCHCCGKSLQRANP
jgi:pseudaminic acid synthase